MSAFLPLGYPLPLEQTGRKFANLGRVRDLVRVPPAICVTTHAFHKVLGAGQLAFLEQFFQELRATVGCFLLESHPELSRAMEQITLPDAFRDELHVQLMQTFGSLGRRRFAVRSSGVTEDSGSYSFAGVYKSILNAEGFEAICSAIVECWKAYYSYTAVAARVRAQQFDASPGMALIVQEMVDARLAGVAFTSGESGVVIEYVEGLGEQLVSGTTTPRRYRTGDGLTLPPAEQAVMGHVAGGALRLREHFGHDVDVEWAWDSQGLAVLQIRPVTAQLEQVNRPVFAWAHLYLDTTLPPDVELGECRAVYTSYVTKRAPSYRLARASQGVAVGAAYVLTFNGAGLLGEPAGLQELLAFSSATRVVLDISPHIRQVVLDKAKVHSYLRDTFGLASSGLKTHTVIMRDFICGEYGFISRLVGSEREGLLVEYSSDGLMNINRGIAHCYRIVLKDAHLSADSPGNLVHHGAEETLAAFRDAIPAITSFTRLVNKHMPDTQLEWALDGGVPYFVDFSREQDEVQLSERAGSVIIAPGVARGPVMTLSDDEMLYKLSIGPAVSVAQYDDVLEHEGLQALLRSVATMPHKPVIFAQRPYAILSAFFDHVAGFVFAEGSLLCHLAILLRESRISAVICPGTTVRDGDEAVVADGVVSIIQGPSTSNSLERQ